MFLHITLPNNLLSQNLAKHKHIPCLCRIGRHFEIWLRHPLPEAQGIVQGWDGKKIDERAPAGTGGEYTHYAEGMVTLEPHERDVYRIIDLSLFSRSVGWCSIYVDGDYGPLGHFWASDEPSEPHA